MKYTALSIASALLLATVPAMAESLPELPSAKAPVPASMLRAPAVKNFKAAKSLEVDRIKFNIEQNNKLLKCIEASQSGTELGNCVGTYRQTVSDYVRKLTDEGRYAEAYGGSPRLDVKAPEAK